MGSDDESDDMMQEVLTTIFSKIDTLRDPARFDAWVAQVTMNTMRQAVRQRSLRRRTLAVCEVSQRSTFETDVEARDVALRVFAVLERLSERERSLLAAYWFTSEDVESIAARSGCSACTLRRRLNRARGRFEKLASREPGLATAFARNVEAALPV
jgi:RNA polymerase sigma-70 factor (ECF subfamily)